MDRRRPRSIRGLAAAVLLFSAVVFAQSDGTARDRAQTLASQALAGRMKADKLQSGWQEVYDNGIAQAERAIALDPTVADAHYALFVNLGRKAERTGVTAQATKVFQLKRLLDKTLELDPNHAHAWEAKGEMLMRLPRCGGSEAEGERALRRSAELDPKWARPPLRLAELDWKKGRLDQARAQAERARELARASGETEFLEQAEALLKQMNQSS